jgi:hypothetical protein
MSALTRGWIRPGKRARRTIAIGLAVLAVLVVVVAAALHYATRTIEDRVLEALGPDSTVEDVKVGLHEVRLVGVRVKAPEGWPSDTALRADEVVVTPKLRQLFSDRIEITEIRIERAYVSAVRPKGGGGLRILPSVTERAKHEGSGAGAAIRAVRFEHCTIDLYDATTPLRAAHIRIDEVTGSVKGLDVPGGNRRSTIDLRGVIKGPAHRGTVSVRGWVEVDRKNAELAIRLRDVDLALFEPYIFTKVKAGVESGSFDLDLNSSVHDNVLHAPGTLTVTGLKLEAAESPIEALASLPRKAGVGALSDEHQRITVPFELRGNLDDPSFSIAGKAALEAGLAFIKAFGVSFEGLIRALAVIFNGLGGGLGGAV